MERFNLKFGDRIVGSLLAGSDGKITLEHNLSFDDVEPVLTVDPYDESNQPLKIDIHSGPGVAFLDATGAERLRIGYDKYGYLDVVDPKKIAGIQQEPWSSPGSAGDHPVGDGDVDFVLNLGPFEKARVYCDRVSRLFVQIELWLKDTSLKTRRSEHTLREEPFGQYDTFLLEINDAAGKRVATVHPMGAWVIGAEGRVELRGKVDREGFLYFTEGGPLVKVSIGSGPSARPVSRPVFKGVSNEGWYWLESGHLGRARPLDEALFRDLLRGVSDLYETRRALKSFSQHMAGSVIA